jgi:TolB-like protein/tRNA A-37 threonylcarbamoyl transferase component Bud32/Tfp pilus assembly protein PilF
MEPDRWRQVERILDVALAVEPSQWSEVLDACCNNDAELRRDVEGLLGRIDGARDFLETPPAAIAAALIDESQPAESHSLQDGRRIGAFRVMREIGRGGMSRVFLAERADGQYEQQVALKLLRPGFDSDVDVVRFRAERQILASLNHPNIARLLDGGLTDEGLPYLVLEHVDGQPIDRYCKSHNLSTRQRLDLFLSVAHAVQYAHHHSVVHRDLKPSNILVTADGTVKLLDFGLAKMLEEGVAREASHTLTRLRWLTPEYAAPEQVRGTRATARTDVYQLGAVLYELLAGKTPFGGRARTMHELETAALECEPEPLGRALHGDLNAIVLKALRKAPEDRYGSADDLAHDIRRYLAGHPVHARRQTLWYRTFRLVARRRFQFAAAAAVAPILLVAAFLLLLAITGIYGDRRARVVAPSSARSVGVLPFMNMSPEPDAWFSDGLSEQIISALSRIDGLRVAARTSSFALRDRSLDMRAIGDTLGVEAVLEGSVRRAGSRMRISAQLIDAETGYHIWSEEYDREVEDVFAVQGQIAAAIASALELRLTRNDTRSLVRAAPSLEAYDLYLRGLFLRNSLSADALQQAATYFDQALEREPDFALAWAGKASVLAPMVYFSYVPREQAVAELRTLVDHALDLDPALGEAHAVLGMFKLFFDWDWAGAEQELRHAIKLNPSDAHAWHHLANYLQAMRRYPEAVEARTRSVELDPLNPRTRYTLGSDLLRAGDPEGALVQVRRARQLDPVHPLALGLGPHLPAGPARVYLQQGRHGQAVDEYIKVATLRDIDAAHLGALRTAFAQSGMPGFFRAWLDWDLQSGAPADPLRIATTWALIGDTARTYQWLDRALAERNPGLIYLQAEPAFQPLLSQPRFARVLSELKFPEE